MKTLFKIVLGSAARHWLSGLLTMLAARGIVSSEFVSSLPIATAISNDYVFDAVSAAVGALLPAALSIVSRLRSKLKQRIALLLQAGATEHEVKEVIASAPIGAQIAATMTANPDKILNAPITI